jgi:circadian clock protein KaiC
MERVKSGVPGLDQLIDGGFPEGFNVMVMGPPGTGKTILALQYLYTGILDGDNGIYVTLDSVDGEIAIQGKEFGWDIDKAVAENKLTILEIPYNKQMRINLFRLIEDKIKEKHAKRLVFDSLSSFLFNVNQFIIQLSIDNLSTLSYDERSYLGEDQLYKQDLPESVEKEKPDPKYFKTSSDDKRVVYLALRELAKLGTTNIIINSASSTNPEATVDGVSEFVCDGLITMKSLAIGETLSRTMEIKKMRYTSMDGGIKSYEITSQGITLR